MSVHYNSFLKGNICIFCGISIKTFRWIFPCCIFLCSCKTFTVCTIPFRNVCYVKPSKMSFIIIWHIIYILNCIVCILGVTHSHYGVRHCDQIDSLYWPREGMAPRLWTYAWIFSFLAFSFSKQTWFKVLLNWHFIAKKHEIVVIFGQIWWL